MKAKPSISIALATYNGARFIGEQLQSFAMQTVVPAELVITDDGSTDGTLTIAAAFAANAPFPVRIEKNAERLGYRGNFLKAAGLCRSDFIAFSDQDDVWLPGKLEACIDAAGNDDEVLLVYHNAKVVTADLQPIDTLDSQSAGKAINASQSLGPWHFALGFTILFRRVLLDFSDEWPHSIDYYHPDKREGHDQWFFFLASCLGSIGYVREPLALHRQHEGNTFGWVTDTRPRLWRLWCNMMATNSSEFRGRALCAGERASIMDRLGQRLGGEPRRRAKIASGGYRRLEKIYQVREQMYAAESLSARLSRLLYLMRSSSYRSGGTWSVGRKSLVRDIVRGVFFPTASRQ